jgi:hypothetical protein
MTNEEFQKMVNSCKSIREVGRILNKTNKMAKIMMEKEQIDFSHFLHGKVYEKMIGEKFGLLTVLSIDRVRDGKRRVFAKCICDCGKEKRIRCDLIKCESYISCGCLSRNRLNVSGSLNHYFKGCGDLGATKFNEIKSGAKRRNIPFEITLNEAWTIFENQDKKCALTGVDLYFGRIRNRHETNASLDRIDSSKGYSKENVEWVLKDINMMKGFYDKDYFIALCNLVAKRHPRDKYT